MKDIMEIIKAYRKAGEAVNAVWEKAWEFHGYNWTYGYMREWYEKAGLWEEYCAADTKQQLTIGGQPGYYTDFGDNETDNIFDWIEELIIDPEDNND